MILKHLLGAILLWVGITTTAQAELTYQHHQKLSYLSAGIGGMAITATGTSVTTSSIDLSYRRCILDYPFSVLVQTNPIFQSTSLFGIQGTAGVGYQVMGKNEMITRYKDDDQIILNQDLPETDFKLFVDAGLTVLPVFGSNSTASYSGIFLDASAYSVSRSLGATLQFNSLNLGSRSITTLGLFVNYFWTIK